MAQQHEFLVRVRLRDGTQCQYRGHYACGCDAVRHAIDWIDAKTVSALRVPPQPPAALSGNSNSNGGNNNSASNWLTQGATA